MPLESEIQNLTAAIENLAFIIKQSAVIQKPVNLSTVKMYPAVGATENIYAPLRTDNEVKNPQVVNEEATRSASEPLLAPPAPIVVKPAPMPVHAPDVVMPGLPTFAVPTVPVAPLGTKAPFSDAKGLMDYLMKSYTTLGAEKGAKIQEVMKTLGASAVNEVTADKYDALFAGVEALK